MKVGISPRVSFGQRVFLSLALLCFVFVGSTHASVITSGTSGLPDTFTLPTGIVLLGHTSTTFTSTNGLVTATLLAGVFSDSTNTFGAGDMTFVYQVFNSAGSADPIGRETDITFTGFSTDVGYASNGSIIGGPWLNGTVAPQVVDKSSAGDTVGFTFSSPLLLPIQPGQTF